MTKFDIDVEKRLLDEYRKQLNALPALNMTRKRIRNRFSIIMQKKALPYSISSIRKTFL